MSDDPLDAARRHIRLCAEYLKLSPEQARALDTAHEMSVSRSPDGSDIAYTNGAADPAAWLRSIEASNPALLNKGKHAPAAEKHAARDWHTATFTELSIGIKTGSADAQAEFERRTRAGSGTPQGAAAPRPRNLTQLMIRAKNGDAAARAELAKAGL